MNLPAFPSHVYSSITVTSAAASGPTISNAVVAAATAMLICASIPYVLAVFGAIFSLANDYLVAARGQEEVQPSRNPPTKSQFGSTLDTIHQWVNAVVLRPCLFVKKFSNNSVETSIATATSHATACPVCSNLHPEMEDNDDIDIVRIFYPTDLDIMNQLKSLHQNDGLILLVISPMVKHLDSAQIKQDTVFAQVNAISLMASDIAEIFNETTIPCAKEATEGAIDHVPFAPAMTRRNAIRPTDDDNTASHNEHEQKPLRNNHYRRASVLHSLQPRHLTRVNEGIEKVQGKEAENTDSPSSDCTQDDTSTTIKDTQISETRQQRQKISRNRECGGC